MGMSEEGKRGDDEKDGKGTFAGNA